MRSARPAYRGSTSVPPRAISRRPSSAGARKWPSFRSSSPSSSRSAVQLTESYLTRGVPRWSARISQRVTSVEPKSAIVSASSDGKRAISSVSSARPTSPSGSFIASLNDTDTPRPIFHRPPCKHGLLPTFTRTANRTNGLSLYRTAPLSVLNASYLWHRLRMLSHRLSNDGGDSERCRSPASS